jgi:hypothetical protein
VAVKAPSTLHRIILIERSKSMAATHIPVSIGAIPKESYIEVWASGEVLPDDVKQLPQMQWIFPENIQKGYSFRAFDQGLTPIGLRVKAGTQGQIIIKSTVDYYFFEYEEGWMGRGPVPRLQEGTVSCRCTWDYKCEKEGQLSWDRRDPRDSQVSDNFSVTISKLDHSRQDPVTGALPYVVLAQSFNYAGGKGGPGITIPLPPVGPLPIPPITIPGQAGSKAVGGDILPLMASLTVTDKYVPPPPPKPTPAPPPSDLYHTVYFPTGKSNADHYPTPVVGDNWASATAQRDQIKAVQNFMNRVLNKYGKDNIINVEVHGYASGLGDTRDNINLSLDRANYVAQLLRQLYHVDLPHDKVSPHGELPIPGNDRDDNQIDRTAKIVVTVKGGAKP